MKTLGSVQQLVFVLACASATVVAGCGCDPGTNTQRAPIVFTPSSSQAVRTAATCGADPAFTAGDTFSLQLLGDTNIAPPYTLITVDLTAVQALNQPTPLMVSQQAQSANVTNAISNDGSVKFSLANGSDPAELDANPLDSVVITVTAMPTADGQPLSAELSLTFDDGRVLDQVYSASLVTPVVACSHR